MYITIIYILIAIILVVYFMSPMLEKFSLSGLSISDEHCDKLADIYYKPCVSNPVCRDVGKKKICSYDRRHNINWDTGNYYTDYGMLV